MKRSLVRGRLLVGLPIALFCAFLVATAGAAIVPSIQRWASPVLCRAPYGTMVTSSQSGMYTPNLSVETFSDACTDGHRHFKPVNALADGGIVFLETFAALCVLLVVLVWLIPLVGRTGRRGSSTRGSLSV
jgi:hypothetical protein